MNKAEDSKRIFAHRGFWRDKSEQNTQQAIKSCIENKFSLETDLRLRGETLVIAHSTEDLEKSPFPVSKSLFSTRVALNIKQDGLLTKLLEYRDLIIRSNSFVFDGSIPEMFQYRNAGIPHALRLSEYERELPWHSDELWIDGFESDWWLKKSPQREIFKNRRITLISPEIHGRDPEETWNFVVENWNNKDFDISICTDFPEKVMEIVC